MTALRLVVVGVAVAVAGLAQDFSVAVDTSHRGDAMDERRVREIVREELAKILSRLPEPNNDPHPEPESDPKASESAPVIPAAVPAPSTLTPAETDAALIEHARRLVLAYIENLPNFVCTQTKRILRSRNSYGSMWAHARPDSEIFAEEYAEGDWRQVREMAAEVQFVNGRESYRNITINGRPSKKKGWRAITSRGEFGVCLNHMFRPEAGTVFTRSAEGVIGGREVAIFRYEMTNPSYGYNLNEKVNLGHKGVVSIDKATGNVLRYDAREILDIPSGFSYWQLSHSIDYGYVLIGGKPHLLPVRSRWVTRYPIQIERDDIEWTSCRKFGAESMVDFE